MLPRENVHQALEEMYSLQQDLAQRMKRLEAVFEAYTGVARLPEARQVNVAKAGAHGQTAVATGSMRPVRLLAPTDVQRPAVSGIVNFFYLPNETICAYLGDGEVAVLKASDTKNLASWVDRTQTFDRSGGGWANLPALRRAGNALLHHLQSTTATAVSIGIGRYHPGITALVRSYEDARAALSLGRRFCGQNGVYSLDNLGIAAFVGVSDEQTKVDLATHLLSPLDGEPELLETLATFFAQDCCPSTAAAALTIHRNTLSYRLDKVTALIGLNPRRFDDGVQIRLALALRALTRKQ